MRHEARQVPSWLIFDVRRKSMSGLEIAILSYLAAGFISMVGAFIWRRQGGGWDAANFFITLVIEGSLRLYLLAFLLWPVTTIVIVLCGQKKPRSSTSEGLAKHWPNKAPEPTPGAVTPRATEGASK